MIKKLRTQQFDAPDLPLPEHWAWGTLLQVAKVVIDCDHKTPRYFNEGVHLVRTTDIRDGCMLLGNTRKVSEVSFAQRSRRLAPVPGDIFFTREAPMGEAAPVPDGERVCLGQRLMLFRLFHEHMSNRFLLYVIQSPAFQRRIMDAAIGMTVKHINVRDVENLFVPVPPKDEQDHIVFMVDALFKLCDALSNHLKSKLSTASHLARFATAAISGIAIEEQEDEPLKVPKTRLIAPLHLGAVPDAKVQAPLARILAQHQGGMSAQDLWQRFTGEIDAFYSQLKAEVAHGWIVEPDVAQMRQDFEEEESA